MNHNPFPKPSPLTKRLLIELVKMASRCYERGWSHGTAGNFSLRENEDLIWQSPTGWCKGELNPKQFVPIDLRTWKPVTPQSPKPSQEMPVHLGIYENIASARAVVHAHPAALVRKSFNVVDGIEFENREMQKHLGCRTHKEVLKIPVCENPTPEEMNAFGKNLGKSLNPKVPLVVLRGHGAYAWGASPMEALSYLEAAEYLCGE